MNARSAEVNNMEQWVWPDIVLTSCQKRQIVTEVLVLAVGAFFTTHIYTFGGNVYRQAKGGPIGPRATCALARCLMNIYDVEFSKILKTNCLLIEFIKRYVDDIRVFMRLIHLGCRWSDGQIKWSKEWEENDNKDGVTNVVVTKG